MAAIEAPMSFDIPKKHKACIYDKPGSISTKIQEHDTPEPGPGEVLVRITHSGVCQSDQGIMENSWRVLPSPTISGQVGGHEGVGIVQKLGASAEASQIKVGDRVGIKWVADACRVCRACYEGQEGICFNVKISGFYYPGTFQQYVLGPASYVTPIPDGLSSADAAPMLCAGLTSYSALRKCGAYSGQWVVISGAGGGLGHIALQIGSRAMGMRMIAIDNGSKEKLAKNCGAEVFLDMSKFDDATMRAEIMEITGGLGAQAVIVCAGSNRAYAHALGLLKIGGTLVCLGMPGGDMVPIEGACPSALIKRQLHIVGVAVGNQKDALEVLDLAARGVIKTHYKIEKLENLTEVFQDMSLGKLQGRVVIDLQ